MLRAPRPACGRPARLPRASRGWFLALVVLAHAEHVVPCSCGVLSVAGTGRPDSTFSTTSLTCTVSRYPLASFDEEVLRSCGGGPLQCMQLTSSLPWQGARTARRRARRVARA